MSQSLQFHVSVHLIGQFLFWGADMLLCRPAYAVQGISVSCPDHAPVGLPPRKSIRYLRVYKREGR